MHVRVSVFVTFPCVQAVLWLHLLLFLIKVYILCVSVSKLHRKFGQVIVEHINPIMNIFCSCVNLCWEVMLVSQLYILNELNETVNSWFDGVLILFSIALFLWFDFLLTLSLLPSVFVETLDKCFKNVCELDLVFNYSKVCISIKYL